MGVTFEAKVYKYQKTLIMIDIAGQAYYLKPGNYTNVVNDDIVDEKDFIGIFLLET